jgi:hypothetical protein
MIQESVRERKNGEMIEEMDRWKSQNVVHGKEGRCRYKILRMEGDPPFSV